MEKIKILTTLEEIKVISDPYRLQILMCFRQFDQPATVKQIADKMGEVPAKVHYHVKKMEKVGILNLIYTKEINGIIAKYYSPTADSFDIRNEQIESPMFKQFQNRTQNLISNIFNEGKKIFIDQLSAFEADNTKEELHDSFVTSTHVYLTEAQYKEIKKYIEDLSHKNKKNNMEGKEKYYMFTSFVKAKDSANSK